MTSEGWQFVANLYFFGWAEFFQQETAQILGLMALCPFSELGFSLTLALWSTHSGTLTHRRPICLMWLEVKLMQKTPRIIAFLPALIIVRRHA